VPAAHEPDDADNSHREAQRQPDFLDSGDRRALSRLIPVLLLIGTTALYLPQLGEAPMYVSHDEIVYSLQAQQLAVTGRDLSGRLLPMYIEYPAQFGRPTWDQPMLIYAIAVVLKVLPFSEFTIRLPMALLAILDVLLLYFVAKILFQSEGLSAAAAVLLALTPSHFMHSRQATDFQLSLPFILAWLLSVLAYLRSGNVRTLAAAGAVLGVGLFGYVAAYVFVPIFAVVTIAALWRCGDPPGRYAWFAAGLAAPALICLPWMLRFPLPFRDVVAHYAVLDGAPSTQSGFVDLVRDFVTSSRLRELPELYASFFDPQFLFISGPLRFRATQLVGVFLVGVAGVLLVGLIRAARRHTTPELLLLAGFLTGPFVATLGGEGTAVWRTLQLAPFGALLAVGALQYVRTVDSLASRSAVVLAFAIPLLLASWYHDFLPHAQAIVRAATVPLAVTGLAVLLQRFDPGRLSFRRLALIAGPVLLATYLAYYIVNHATIVGMVVIAALALAAIAAPRAERFAENPTAAAVLLALVTGQFMYLYVDYGAIGRVGPIPTSALVMALRLLFASIAIGAVALVVRLQASKPVASGFPPSLARLPRELRRDQAEARSAKAGSRTSGQPKGGPHVGFEALFLVATQLAYYTVDAFTDYRLRAVHVAIVLAATVALAILMRGHGDRRAAFGRIAMAGLFGLVLIQFATFHRDYFGEFQARGSADVEGNVRGAFESVIERTRQQQVPAIYLGKIGPYYYGELFWKFYLIKHHREDLLARTVADMEFKPERVRTLPPGSLVITSPARQIDHQIDELAASGVVSGRELLKAPDGAPIFWILQTGGTP
jgi:4-amino-4-deoxy-L-arabinose transferase-like glycosyltransferase